MQMCVLSVRYYYISRRYRYRAELLDITAELGKSWTQTFTTYQHHDKHNKPTVCLRSRACPIVRGFDLRWANGTFCSTPYSCNELRPCGIGRLAAGRVEARMLIVQDLVTHRVPVRLDVTRKELELRQ